MDYNGELMLALRKIAEIRRQLEEAGEKRQLWQLADKVRISAEACEVSVTRAHRLEEERMMLDE